MKIVTTPLVADHFGGGSLLSKAMEVGEVDGNAVDFALDPAISFRDLGDCFCDFCNFRFSPVYR